MDKIEIVSTPSNLQETALYQRLCDLVKESDLLHKEGINRQKALSLTNDICADASKIMKMATAFSPEYTLHDETHLLNVTYLMGIILKESGSFEQLSYLEITILILAAYLHDIGMAPPREKFEKIISSSDYSVFRKTRLRELDGLQELLNLLENPNLSDGEKTLLNLRVAEIEQSIFTEYLRNNHGSVGAEEIVEKWSNDPRWVVEGYNLAETVAWVSKGHSFHTQQLVSDYSDNYPLDKLIGQKEVNILYCTIILRLSDVLDFDRERTPQILFENISPRNEISIKEWNKHKSVTGWRISNSEIIFACECTHPVYEKTLRSFLDYIDYELTSCHFLVANFPQRNQIAENYKLKLPPIVSRTKIIAKNDAYSYLDLSFSLSHEEIMKFLMGKELWGGTSLCVRELIQNAYDAIRHRRALELAAGNNWIQGKITLIQRLNKNCIEFECRDNGIGMNHHILNNYFFKVGRSYYLSPEFEQERTGLKERKADFDPISQFGIGIVSTFLIGNSLQVRTQRYLGPNKGCGESLLVEVDGFSQMVVIRTLSDDEPKPGTEITVIGKKMSYEEASDKWSDPLHLLDAAQFYAAALDVPIEIIIEPPFNTNHLTIPPPTRPLRLKTEFEENPEIPFENYLVLERDFSLMSDDCEGTVRMFFLKNKEGKLSVKNEWGYWDREIITSDHSEIKLIRVSDGKKIVELDICRAVLAQDGILVSSDDRKRDQLHFFGAKYPAPWYNFPGSFFINLHGKEKLPLKPNRAPYQPIHIPDGKEETIWWDFERRLNLFIGCILEDVLRDNKISPDHKTFWSIVQIYNLSLYGLSKETGYSYIFLPSTRNNDQSTLTWESMNSLNSQGLKYISLGLQSSTSTNIWSLACIPLSGFGIELCDDATIEEYITSIVRATTIMIIEDRQIFYEIRPFSTPFNRLSESHHSTSAFDLNYFQVYADELQNYLSINNPARGMNNNHPVAQFIKSHSMISDTYKWFRWGIVIVIKELVNDKNFDEKQPDEWGEETLRSVRNVISHWKKVKWDELPSNLKPPYRILFPSSGRSYNISIEYLEERIKNLAIKEEIKDIGLANLE